MAHADRKALIEEIERIRESRVVVFVTGDRVPAPAQLGDDAVRPLYDHLREIGQVPRLDLLIYSRGGAIDVPWRMATALRSSSDSWNVLVRKGTPTEQAMGTIIETLAERVYAHGHAIGFQEAKDIGFPCLKAPDELDTAMWSLLVEQRAALGVFDLPR